jgi:hypothetical protein
LAAGGGHLDREQEPSPSRGDDALQAIKTKVVHAEVCTVDRSRRSPLAIVVRCLVIESRPPVGDFKAPSSARAIAALGEGDTRKNLLKFGAWMTGSEAGGEDLLADAIVYVCDPKEGRPWDPERGSFGTHMRMVMRDLTKQERRSSRNRHEVLSPKKVVKARSTAPVADVALADARATHRRHQMGEILRERLAARPFTLRVFDARLGGVERADDLARLFVCTIEEIYEANRQIVYHAANVLREQREAEDAEMKERRERARKDKLS